MDASLPMDMTSFQLPTTVAKPTSAKPDAMGKTAKDFESMFMSQMLQPMMDGLEVDDTFGGGHGEEVMRGFMVQQYGKSMAAGDHSGLSTAIKNEMIHMQAKMSGGAA